MTTSHADPDPTMDAIGQAVAEGRAGDIPSARRKLLALWSTIGVTGDPLHRCSLAHYLADLYEDPAHALAWNIRALDAADAVTERRAQEHDAGLHIAGFYPSLHLNLADDYRRLGSFEAATEHIEAAEALTPAFLRTPTVTWFAAPSRRSPTPSPRKTAHDGPPHLAPLHDAHPFSPAQRWPNPPGHVPGLRRQPHGGLPLTGAVLVPGFRDSDPPPRRRATRRAR